MLDAQCSISSASKVLPIHLSDKAGIPVIAGLSAGIAFVILFASFTNQFPSSQESAEQVLYMVQADGSTSDIVPVKVEEESCICLQVWDAETYVQKTGKSAIKAEFLIENVTVQRGSYADVPLLLRHMGGANAEQYVTVRVMPPTGYTLYPKSVAEASTPEERFEAAKEGTVLDGGIDLAQFVVARDTVTIDVGSEQVIYVRFVVPANLTGEANGTYVPIELEVTPQSGDSQDPVFNENTGIELIIP